MRHRGLALRGLLPAPLPNPGVVAREEHVGDAHAAIFGRPRELRAAGQLSAERVLLQGLRVADHAGDTPGLIEYKDIYVEAPPKSMTLLTLKH